MFHFITETKTIKTKVLVTAIIIFSLFYFSTAFAERKYLFTWDEGSGTNMPGWTWSNDVAYGHPGWTLDKDGPFGGGKTYMWGYGPRSFEKSDYHNDTSAEIIDTDEAPSTSSGGALRIFDTGQSTTYQSCWWLWYDGEQLSKKNITDANTDRWSFYIKLSGITGATSTSPGATFHVGTYLTDDTACPSYGTGDGAPYEGPGNQHYYHYLYMSPGAWIHVELDRHPTHRRDSHVAGDDPAFILPTQDQCSPSHNHAMHYYEHLSRWYMEIARSQTNLTSYLLDDMYFYSTRDPQESAEPNQNDTSVTSLWVGYWPETGKWQMGWQDMSYVNQDGMNMNDNTESTFEIRWSTAPITNANYSSANIVAPEWLSGPEHTSYPHGVRRADSWSTRIWTQFTLPAGVTASHQKIYFAIKDVSVQGGNAGTSWPWNRPDGHNAPSSYIHAINYALSPEDQAASQKPIIKVITISE